MCQTRYVRAFSLAELLVVIAIIGILSTVVLASLNSARIKGNDTAIKANLSTVQIQAENFYGTSSSGPPAKLVNTYGTASITGKCPGFPPGPGSGSLFALDATIKNALIATANITGTTLGNMYCYNSTASYAIEAVMSDGNYWCIDSVGNSGVRATIIDTSGSTFACPPSS